MLTFSLLQIFLEYASLLSLLAQDPSSPSFDTLLDSLLHSVPTLLDHSPKSLKLQVCASEMQSRLTKTASERQQHLGSVRPAALQGADRLAHLAGANAAFLEKSLEAACRA